MRKAAVVAVASMAASAALLNIAGPAAAATYPEQNWTQLPGNAAGGKFTANGDRFEVWDNVDDDMGAWVEFNYKGIDDDWKEAIYVLDRYAATNYNLQERIDGKRTAIYFRVCSNGACSVPSWQWT